MLFKAQGCPLGKIIKVKGQHGKRKLIVLIDCGSTHSFLNEAIAKELNSPTSATFPLAVTVANGSKMFIKLKCPSFTWVMQGQEFTAELRLLKLGGCDIVLGMGWMWTVSPLVFDFNNLEVTFEVGRKKVTLTGSLDVGECKLITGKKCKNCCSRKGILRHNYIPYMPWSWGKTARVTK